MPFFTGGFGLATTALDYTLGKKKAKYSLGRDYRSKAKYEDLMHSRAMDRGLTEQEYYGSPAAGGATTGGPGGAGAVLGNERSFQDFFGKSLMMRGQDIELQKTKMQTDAAIETAKISAGATTGAATIGAGASRYAADIQKRIAENKLELSNREFNQVTLPAAAANIGKTEQETKKLINEVVTSTPEFQRSKILLQMGVENTIQTALLQRFGVDITSKEAMAKLTDQQFRNVLAVLVGVGSHANRELQGLGSAATGLLDKLNPFSDGTPQYQLRPIPQQ